MEFRTFYGFCALASLAACSGAAPDARLEKTANTAAPITDSAQGGGYFQLGVSGNCISPTTPWPTLPTAGTALHLANCNYLGGSWTPVLGLSSDNVLDGSQGTIQFGGGGSLNLCLEANYTTGAVQLNTCSHSETQEWTWTLGQFRPPSQPGKCLTTGTSVGSPVTLSNCDSSKAQGFVPVFFPMLFANGIPASSQFMGPHPLYVPPHVPSTVSNKSLVQCLDTFLDLESVAGAPIDNFECNRTNAQWFNFDASSRLKTVFGTCLTVVGSLIEIEGCNGSAWQQWLPAFPFLVSAPTLAAEQAYCLDVTGESTATETAATVSPCSSSAHGQVWVPNLIWPQVQKLDFVSKYFDLQEENAQAYLTVYSNGNFKYSGQVHDYGAGADTYALDVFPTNPLPGTHGPLFWAQGEVYGTFESGSRDSTWNATGVDPQIESSWSALQSGVTFNLHIASDIGSDVLGVFKDIGIATVLAVGGTCAANGGTVSAYRDDHGGSGVQVNCN